MFDDAGRYFTDNDRSFNPDLIPAPDLCATCAHNDDPKREVVCNLTRADEQDEEVFICFDYRPVSPNVDKEAVLRELCGRAGVECPEDSAGADGDDAGPVSF